MLISSFHEEESDNEFDDIGEAPVGWKNVNFHSDDSSAWSSSEEGLQFMRIVSFLI